MANKDWYEAARNCICNSGSPLVRIDRNKNTPIENVNITVGLYPVASSCSNMKGHRERLKEMITEDILINTVTKKQVYLIDVLERFRYIVYKENIQTIVRMKALFSPFSTIREESDTDDLSQLELDEKRILLDLVNHGCIFKLLMSLDFTRAVVCGYGMEEISQRIGDLCRTCESLKDNDNFQVAICMEACNYEPIWTFDEVCIEKQMMFHEKSNYKACYWSSNLGEIKAFNIIFDREFMLAFQQMYLAWNLLHIDSLPQYILYCMDQWCRLNPQYLKILKGGS